MSDARYGQEELTVEVVDSKFPLQRPGGIVEIMKGMLADGVPGEALGVYRHLQEVDRQTVGTTAEELLMQHDLPGDLDVVNALKYGIQAGLRLGRQEGADALNQVLTTIGE